MILAIIAVIWFFLIHPVYALSPPILSDPPNNSVIYSGPKLSWQAVIDSMGYKIMIDDESSITSPYAKTPYYTENTYYSPKLNYGSYYWKVGAKDNNGTWFWSDVWSFTLSAASSSPTPSPTPFSSSSSSTSPASSSFTMSNTPTQINSDQSFKASVTLSLPSNPNTLFYLKGAFKKADSSNYFGKTLVGSSWVKNGSIFSDQYKITTDSSGNWSGNLEVQPDSEDSGFTDTSDYIFKIGRYTSSGAGPTWSNEASVKIASSEKTDQGGVNLSESYASALPSVSKKLTSSDYSKNSIYNIASVAGGTAQTASPSANPEVEIKAKKQINFPLIIGLVLVTCGFSSLGYVYLRSRNRSL